MLFLLQLHHERIFFSEMDPWVPHLESGSSILPMLTPYLTWYSLRCIPLSYRCSPKHRQKYCMLQAVTCTWVCGAFSLIVPALFTHWKISMWPLLNKQLSATQMYQINQNESLTILKMLWFWWISFSNHIDILMGIYWLIKWKCVRWQWCCTAVKWLVQLNNLQWLWQKNEFRK